MEVERKGHWVVMRRMVWVEVPPWLARVRILEAVWPELTCPKLRMLPGESGPVTESTFAPEP